MSKKLALPNFRPLDHSLNYFHTVELFCSMNLNIFYTKYFQPFVTLRLVNFSFLCPESPCLSFASGLRIAIQWAYAKTVWKNMAARTSSAALKPPTAFFPLSPSPFKCHTAQVWCWPKSGAKILAVYEYVSLLQMIYFYGFSFFHPSIL